MTQTAKAKTAQQVRASQSNGARIAREHHLESEKPPVKKSEVLAARLVGDRPKDIAARKKKLATKASAGKKPNAFAQALARGSAKAGSSRGR